MAKRNRQNDADLQATRETAVLDLEDAYSAEPLNAALAKLYGEMGIEEGANAANVYVYKIEKESGNELRVWRGTPDEYDIDAIAKRFGSGEYLVRVYVQGESNRFGLKGSKTFHMLLDPQDDARIAQQRNGTAPATSAAQPQATGLAAVSPEQLASLIAGAVRAAMPAPVQTVNPMEMLKGIGEVMRSIVPPQTTPQMNPLEVFRAAAELAADRDPIEKGVNATGMDVFLKLIDKFAPMFGDVLKTASGEAPAHPALPAPSAPQVPAVAASAQPAEQTKPVQGTLTKEQQESAMRLKMGLSFLCMQAEAGNDPVTYAEMTVDNVPEEVLTQMLENPAWLDHLAQFEPNVKKHADWFNKLREEVKSIMSEDAEPPAA